MDNRASSAPRPKKALGQNFLQDPNICRKIVSCLNIQEGDKVMEIGPGPGALTGILMAAPVAELVLVEKDRDLAAARRADAEARAATDGAKDVRVIEADALTLSYEDFADGWKFIGNLPYNVASPLMWEIFSRARGLKRAVFMIQKEVGQRLVAAPGSGAYGALTVWVQTFARPRLEFIVPPHVFYPRPKVDSAVVSFEPRTWDEPLPDLKCLAATIKACFQMRRKQMGGIARSGAGRKPNYMELLNALGIAGPERPETLTVQDFHKLTRSGIFC